MCGIFRKSNHFNSVCTSRGDSLRSLKYMTKSRSQNWNRCMKYLVLPRKITGQCGPILMKMVTANHLTIIVKYEKTKDNESNVKQVDYSYCNSWLNWKLVVNITVVIFRTRLILRWQFCTINSVQEIVSLCVYATVLR